MARPTSAYVRDDDSSPAPLPAGTRVACVVSRYHREIGGAMRDSAAETLAEFGLAPGDLVELQAPGAFELPVLAQALAQRADIAAVLCFGLVLKGETEHDRHISSAVAQGLTRVALDTGKPVAFGVLTCNLLGQARRRARRKDEGGLDKGREVALAMIHSLHALEEARTTTKTAGSRR